MFCWNCGNEIGDRMICPCCGVKQVPTQGKGRRSGNSGSIVLTVVCAAVGGILLIGMLVAATLVLRDGGRDDADIQIQRPAATEATTPTRAPAAESEKPSQNSRPTVKPRPTVPPETDAPAQNPPAQDAPAQDPPAQEEEEVIDENSRALPDLASFLETKYTQDVWAYTHYVTCIVDDNEEIVEAVLDLLLEPRYQLKQMGVASDSEGTHYTYEYTGKNKDIDWVYLKAGGKYHVKLTVKPYGRDQKALIMYTHPEFYLKDPGKTWKEQTADPADPTSSPTPVPDDGETVEVRENTTIHIRQGSAVKLHCTYDEWDSSYDVYEWRLKSGSSVIAMDATYDKCDVLGLARGTAVIEMEYFYSYKGPDVLTGNMRTKHTSRTREYTIVVE